MALLDVLQKRMQAQQAAAQGALATDQSNTQQAATLLGAKTGKQGANTGIPNASSLQEGAAIDEAKAALSDVGKQNSQGLQALGQKETDANAQLAQKQAEMDASRSLGEQSLAQQGALAREGIASQESQALAKLTSSERTKIDETANAAERSIQNMLTEKKLNENNLFQQFEQDNRELAYRRDSAQLEQLSMNLALRDKAYLDEINAIGEERNLKNNIQFAQETQRILMGENTVDVLQQIGWKESDLTDELAFSKKMAQMSIDDAIKIMNAQIAQDNTTAMISGVVNLGGMGVNAYMDSQAAAKKQELSNLSTIKQADKAWLPTTEVPNSYETTAMYGSKA